MQKYAATHGVAYSDLFILHTPYILKGKTEADIYFMVNSSKDL